jgi:hypothetical protein
MIRKETFPFSHLNIINKSSSLTPNNRQEKEHVCIFDCWFLIPFGEPLLLPSNCREELTSNACEVEVEIDYSGNYTLFGFWDETIDLIIDDIRLDTYSAEIVSFEFDDNILSYILAYKCSNGDQCEWNYIIENLPKVIATDFVPLYNSLSPLIYHEKSDSNVSHCYSMTELIECSSGVCDFTQTLDEENFTLTDSRKCLVFDRPRIYFGKYRYTPGPMKYDFDYLYFACNINECNSPSNELAIKRLIGFPDDKNLGLARTGSLYITFCYFIIHIFCLT